MSFIQSYESSMWKATMPSISYV